MTPPVEGSSLPPDLVARFAALRSPRTPPPAPAEKRDQDLETRLKRLEPPTDEQVDKGIPIEINTADDDDDDDDAAVERFLLATLSAPRAAAPPLASDSRRRRDERTMTTMMSTEAFDSSSGIEIEFMRRSAALPAFGGPIDADADDDDEDDLIRRMRDEVKVEANTSRRNEAGVETWQARINGLRGVVGDDNGGGGQGERIRGLEDAPPPGLGRLERELDRRKRKDEKKRSQRHDDDDDDSDSESDSESETETESERDSEDGSG
ncbi:hypothetical protein JCM11491_006316 [Sporobolomyces phaffii]